MLLNHPKPPQRTPISPQGPPLDTHSLVFFSQLAKTTVFINQMPHSNSLARTISDPNQPSVIFSTLY